VCYYCACNKVVVKDRNRAQPYVDDVVLELALQGKLFGEGCAVDQLHWGGGMPTFLSDEQMREIMAATGQHFALKTDDTGEYSIEIDPREANAGTIAVLRDHGFNRISLGVQDFDERMQGVVKRIQRYAENKGSADLFSASCLGQDAPTRACAAISALIYSKDGALKTQVQHFLRIMLHGKNLQTVEY
jgi:oxygen-independent coproporphyrinogen-3 oxidase